MPDDDEEGEATYKLLVPGSSAPRENGSQKYTGQGKATYDNQDTYDGIYVEGFRQGKGIYTFKHGDCYDGHYHQNKKTGFGRMTYEKKAADEDGEEEEEKVPRGGTYLGFFHSGLRGCPPGTDLASADAVGVSEGTFTYINGDVYVGQWLAGKKHGIGTYTYAKDDTKLVGEWEGGKITSGRWVFPNGTFYSGSFRYNKPFGKGVWVFKNGNQLTGDYNQKEMVNEDDAGGDEEGEVKPDPKVWCHFKMGACTAVQGGTMLAPKGEDP
mmetsp:Transcript_51649/g.145551  ORF Transcript_51649/g.145551 Transcript_51649/m.145551 type:complete len:268 (-) Transcript_51649:90-893(-)